MKLPLKILLSIPSIIAIFFFCTYILFPSTWSGIITSMDDYYFTVAIIQGLTIFQVFFLITFLWKQKAVENKIKRDWTFLLIIFCSVSSLIFIWSKVVEFDSKSSK